MVLFPSTSNGSDWWVPGAMLVTSTVYLGKYSGNGPRGDSGDPGLRGPQEHPPLPEQHPPDMAGWPLESRATALAQIFATPRDSIAETLQEPSN